MLDGRYNAGDIRLMLKTSFTPVGSRFTKYGSINIPYFYEANDAIVFPPVSDFQGSTNLTTISTALKKARDYLNNDKYFGKKMIFPVVEEQRFLGLFPRNHWVTLHYDPNSQTATLIDSRPWLYSAWYPATPMKEQLINGLSALNSSLSVRNFEIKYQSVQWDNIHCGDWTSINIEALANGVPIETHFATLSANDKEGIILHNQDKRGHENKNSIYQPKSSVIKTDSIKTLSTPGSMSYDSPGDNRVSCGLSVLSPKSENQSAIAGSPNNEASGSPAKQITKGSTNKLLKKFKLKDNSPLSKNEPEENDTKPVIKKTFSNDIKKQDIAQETGQIFKR